MSRKKLDFQILIVIVEVLINNLRLYVLKLYEIFFIGLRNFLNMLNFNA